MAKRSPLDRIRKLLNLADRSESEGERAAALAAAHRLMLRHNVTLAEASDHEVDRFDACDAPCWIGRSISAEKDAACAVLNKCFLVCAYVCKHDWEQSVNLFGERHNVAIARYVFVFLCREFRRRWRSHVRLAGHQRGQASYCLGLAGRVIQSLSSSPADDPDTGQLIRLSDRVEQAWQRTHPTAETKSLSVRDGGQYAQGYEDGRDIHVRTPLRGETQRAIGGQTDG